EACRFRNTASCRGCGSKPRLQEEDPPDTSARHPEPSAPAPSLLSSLFVDFLDKKHPDHEGHEKSQERHEHDQAMSLPKGHLPKPEVDRDRGIPGASDDPCSRKREEDEDGDI